MGRAEEGGREERRLLLLRSYGEEVSGFVIVALEFAVVTVTSRCNGTEREQSDGQRDDLRVWAVRLISFHLIVIDRAASLYSRSLGLAVLVSCTVVISARPDVCGRSLSLRPPHCVFCSRDPPGCFEATWTIGRQRQNEDADHPTNTAHTQSMQQRRRTNDHRDGDENRPRPLTQVQAHEARRKKKKLCRTFCV